MKRLLNIGKTFNRTAEEVESDLRYILKQKHSKESIHLEAGKEYYLLLIELLKQIGALEDRFFESLVTHEGLRLIKRGYIIYNFESIKTQENKKIQREKLSLLIGLSGVIVGIAGLFFPRQNTLRQTDAEFRKLDRVIVQDTVDFTPKMNEISQANDSTNKENYDKNK